MFLWSEVERREIYAMDSSGRYQEFVENRNADTIQWVK